jgi:hypothetical protein
MHVLQPLGAQRLHDALDARRDRLGALDLVVFDVDDPDPETDRGIEIREHLELVVAAPRELEYEVIGVQPVEQRDQIAPEPAQRRLSTVVAEADVDRLLVDDAVEQVIDGIHCPRRVLRALGDACLVQLHHVGLDQLELTPQHAGDVHRQIRDVLVVAVVQQPRQQVRPRARELERLGRQRPRELGIVRQVERAVADLADDVPAVINRWPEVLSYR